MDKEKAMFRLKDVNEFLNKRFGNEYKFVSLKRTNKNFTGVCIAVNGKKFYLEFAPFDLKMFEIVENNNLTKVSENGIRLDWLRHLVGVYGQDYIKAVETYCAKQDLEIYKEYTEKINGLKSALEDIVAKKIILNKKLAELKKEELFLRNAIEDRNKEMIAEIDFNNNLVGYLTDCEYKKKKGARYMAKLIKELCGEVKETSEQKGQTLESKREIDTTGEMECGNVK